VKISVHRHTCTLESQATLSLCSMSFRTCPVWLALQAASLSPVGFFCLLELRWFCWLSTSTRLMFPDMSGDDPAMWYVTRFTAVFKKTKWAHGLAHTGLHTWLVSKCNLFSPWRICSRGCYLLLVYSSCLRNINFNLLSESHTSDVIHVAVTEIFRKIGANRFWLCFLRSSNFVLSQSNNCNGSAFI
jgi:hypothetical protein